MHTANCIVGPPSADSWKTLLVTGLVGIAGAVVGGLFTLGASRADRRAADGRALAHLIGQVWGAADRAWRASLDYGVANAAIRRAQMTNQGLAASLIKERESALRGLTDAGGEGRAAVAQIKLIYPALAKSATFLMSEVAHYDFGQHEAEEARYAAAVKAFEDSATVALQDRIGRRRCRNQG